MSRRWSPSLARPPLRAQLSVALLSLALLIQALGCATPRAHGPAAGEAERASELYGPARQFTFAGRRSGEGYYGPDGREIVFQSEREPGNPFYQIYRMSLDTGETNRVSTGEGRTTCGWIHPEGETVLFASTHLDPAAEAKQAKELAERESGATRRYAWDYDDRYDLFAAHADGRLEQLTRAVGYDAEASYSPDGRLIAFASNRQAYGHAITAEDRERLAVDPAYFIDLYLLDTETNEITQLTTSPGYDGGPFFSPDGERIVWRRFSQDGARAEIHSIRLDGSDERILTRLGVMSWAPFYHPSGDYIVFTTNKHGYENFELYLVDAEGRREPVRVTTRDGFDGLPVFSPAGDELLWTSNRTTNKQSQLFRAPWNDDAARRALGLDDADGTDALPIVALPVETRPEISARDLAAHVLALTDPRMQGRRAGTEGEAVAIDYLARAMREIDLTPAGADDSYLHPFEFTAGIALGLQNDLTIIDGKRVAGSFEVDSDWRPLAFSQSGEIEPSPIVFAGYGLVAPAVGGAPAIDDYAGLDVENRWVLVFRDLPESFEGPRRQQLQLHASLRYKSMAARDHGARGILFASGPRGRFRDELAPLRFDASLAGTRIAVVSIRDAVAERLMEETGLSLAEIQERTDRRHDDAAHSDLDGFETSRIELGARIDLETQRDGGHNVVGRLQVGSEPSAQSIVLGAHFDHLGHGEGSSSLASGNEVGEIHPGADDNASGVAVLLEIAEQLAERRNAGAYLGERDFVFAAWSGEELGLLGSDRWVEQNVNPHSNEFGPIAYLNFDMVGRLENDLVVQGLGSSPDWTTLLEQAAGPLEMAIVPQQDAYLPTDTTSFYTRRIPVLNAFTGVHSEYHTPNDVADRLNFDGSVAIAELFARIAEAVSRHPVSLAYTAQAAPSAGQGRSGFRVFLGTVPDYARTDVEGVRLTGVAPAGPAEKAGLRAGDVIVEVDGKSIENLYDYTYALEALRVGEPAQVVVERGDSRIPLEVVPSSRD